jgi:hypothetical protein
MIEPINITYSGIDNPIEAKSAEWDMSEDGNIIIPSITTTGDMGSTKEDLDALIQEVIQGYEAN